jgi:hypothetical protein
MSGTIPFPLTLNLKNSKYLELRLQTSLKDILDLCKNQHDRVKKIQLIQFKNGREKKREVYNPSVHYKMILRRINKTFLSSAKLPYGVLGGVIGKSIDELAQIHCGQKALLSIDFEKFFPSIASGRVKNFFRKTGCINEVCDILTDLITFEGFLPQGFPTSTMIANLIAFDLDDQHLTQCKKIGIRRTRWVDDITFSGETETLAINAPALIGAVNFHRFKISNHKTKFEIRQNKPEVVGLEVSGEQPRLPQIAVDKIMDILLECERSGWNVVQEHYERDAWGNSKNLKASLDAKIRRIEKYKHEEAFEVRKIFNSIKWETADKQTIMPSS